MRLITRGLIVLATAGAIAIPASVAVSDSGPTTSRRRPVVAETTHVKAPSPDDYLTTQLEHYLTDDGIAYIRPGMHIKVNSTEFNADRQLVVDFNILDDYDQPLDRNGKMTPGAVSTTFMLAWYDPSIRQLVNYNTRGAAADRDRTGTYTELEMGHYVYTFGTKLPADFDMSATHQLGIYGNRNLQTEIEKTYYDNVEYEFRPDGNAVAPTERWDKISQGACLNCHEELALHGGQRRDVKLCVMCHNMQSSDPDTGNSVDFASMIHKIHSGPNLETPLVIIGFGGSVHDYSEVTFPQDRRNCANCHEGRSASQKPTQSEVWYTYPSRRACGACHDHVDFASGEGHIGGPQADDSACANCHVPESEKEFDASIKGAHTIPEKSKQLTGMNVEILSVTNTAPGMTPTVVIKATQDDGTPIDWTQNGRSQHPILAGPASSYTTYYREDASSTGVYDAATGAVTYTFTNPIPEDATGTWTISGDFRRSVNVQDGQGNNVSVTEAAINPIEYFSVDGSAVKPRRQSAVINQCNDCHDRLALHGGQRFIIDECVICHNPTATDEEVRLEGTNASISFQRMIHRIHTGHELIDDYTIYGFRSSIHNYNEVTYPGDRRNCQKCHTNSGYLLPVPKGADPVHTPDDYFDPQGPGTAACLGCHDNQDAAAHAYLNTTMFPGSDKPAESCGSCHGENATWSVDKVHAK